MPTETVEDYEQGYEHVKSEARRELTEQITVEREKAFCEQLAVDYENWLEFQMESEAEASDQAEAEWLEQATAEEKAEYDEARRRGWRSVVVVENAP